MELFNQYKIDYIKNLKMNVSDNKALEIYNKYENKIHDLKFSDQSIIIDDEQEKMIEKFMNDFELDISYDGFAKIYYDKFINTMMSIFNSANKLFYSNDGRINYDINLTKIQLFKFVNEFNIFETIHDRILHPHHYYLSNKENFIKKVRYTFFPTDQIFKPYRSYDYNFLNIYNDKVKDAIIKQIEIDSSENQKMTEYDNVYDNVDLLEDLETILNFLSCPSSNKSVPTNLFQKI